MARLHSLASAGTVGLDSSTLATELDVAMRVATGASRTSVFVVEPDGKLTKRNVKISAAQNNQWVVLEGLKAGEQVMVDGFQKLQIQHTRQVDNDVRRLIAN